MVGSQNGSVLTPGSADDSFLVEQIVEGEMPKRGPQLTPDQIQIIVDWINAGALDN
ncbi:MAG: cytochrome c [Chloroflexota bacterium]